MKLFCMLWLFILGMPLISYVENQDTVEVNPLFLHLEVVSDDANHSEQQIIVQLTAKNEGTQPLLLPRLQEGIIEKYRWWRGWQMYIRHLPEGEVFKYLDSPQELLVLYKRGKLTREEYNKFDYFSDKDLVKLLPGDAYSVRINLANAKQYDDDGRILRRLHEVTGEYDVMASLGLYAGNAPDWYLQAGWSGYVESNTVTVVIGERSEQEAPNTPDENTKK